MASIYPIARNLILASAAVLGLLSIVAVVGGAVARVTPLIVVSGSMEPTIPTGSLLFTRETPASEVQVGDIVTVERPVGGGSVTHRVVATSPKPDGRVALELQGDANTLADFDRYVVGTVSTYIGHAPLLGHVALFFQTAEGLLLAAAAGFSLIALFLLEPRHRNRHRATTNDCPAELAGRPLPLSEPRSLSQS